MKSTSTDEGIKPERVDKADGKGRSDEKKSPQAAHFHGILPPLGDATICLPILENLIMYD